MTTTGEQGPTGDKGLQGNPGATGDKGQQGETGEVGDKGRQGETGVIGPAGPKGPPILSRNQTLALFLLAVLCFALLSWRGEINAHRTDENSRQIENTRVQQSYQSCVQGRTILAKFDTFVTSMAKVEAKGTRPGSPTYDKSAVPTRLERVANYRAAKIHLPDCGPKP